MDQRPSIVLADEQTMFREGVAAACQSDGRLRIVGQCGDGPSALAMCSSLRPDILVADQGLARLNSLEVIRRLKMSQPSLRVIFLSMRRDKQAVLDALRRGASAYLLKSDPMGCLLDAIRRVLDGFVFLSPRIQPAEVFMPPTPAKGRRSYEELCFRERQVFDMAVAGLRTKDIAGQLGLSPKTVSTYRLKMMARLGIEDLPGLVRYAIRKGLIPL